jgi:DNA-directed RNA polymerase specialized sigma54-like protein
MDPFLEILELPLQALRERVAQAVLENPVLEVPSLDHDDGPASNEFADVVIEPTETGDYAVRVQEGGLLAIVLNPRYLELCHDPKVDWRAQEYLRRKIKAGQRLAEAIRQRREILEQVARALFRCQRTFLDRGPDQIVQLSPQQVADEAGIPAATVRRALHAKQARTSHGVFALEDFLFHLPRPSAN